MKPPNYKSSHYMFFFGVVTFVILILLMLFGQPEKEASEVFSLLFLYRVLTGLAAAGISLSIPGMLKINYTPSGDNVNANTTNDGTPEKMTLAEKEPVIAASGAIAVFVLVYLFNPIGV